MPATAPCCPVTKEYYEADGPNKPRSLPCGHSISHAALVEILREPDADRRACPIDRQRLLHADASAYPINYAIVEIIGTLPPREAADSDPAPAPAADPTLPQPPAAAVALEFAEVMPRGSVQRVPDGVWQRIEQAYRLPRDAVDGSPSDWSVLGWTAGGHCVYRGFDKSGGGIARAVALCYAGTLPSSEESVSNEHALRAAVAPHVALQLLPDVRPLLPALHGFMLASPGAGGGTGRLSGSDKQVWLVYGMQGSCLALHLEQQPQHSLPAKLVIPMFRQLASAVEALHRNNLTTATLNPISVASVRLDSVDGPSSVRIAPYAREIPAEENGYSSTGAFEALCAPPEAGQGGAVADGEAADVWRTAAVAAIALTGETLKEEIEGGAPASPAMLLSAVTSLRQTPARLPAELADILEGCLHPNPYQRWTAERMHAALLSESLDNVPAPAPAPVVFPIARPAARLEPAAPEHVAIALPMQQPAPSATTGQRPTRRNGSLAGACVIRTCYTIGFLFALIIAVGTLSAIFG